MTSSTRERASSRAKAVRHPIASLALPWMLAHGATASAQLAMTQFQDVRLVYIDGTQSYLVPHAARAAVNSIEFQKKQFDSVLSQDGRFLYGSSYYTSVSNIFRYEIAAAKLDAVTNAETGLSGRGAKPWSP
jgi:hypothetical protein